MADEFLIMEVEARKGNHPEHGDFVLIRYRLKDDPQPWRQVGVLPEEGQSCDDIIVAAGDIIEQLVLGV